MRHGIVRARRAPGTVDPFRRTTSPPRCARTSPAACGLQEMYISHRPAHRAQLGRPRRRRASGRAPSTATLRDVHWIGGDPARGQVYGWASWSPGRRSSRCATRATSRRTSRWTSAPIRWLSRSMRARSAATRLRVYGWASWSQGRRSSRCATRATSRRTSRWTSAPRWNCRRRGRRGRGTRCPAYGEGLGAARPHRGPRGRRPPGAVRGARVGAVAGTADAPQC